jgi:hypothetical protein
MAQGDLPRSDVRNRRSKIPIPSPRPPTPVSVLLLVLEWSVCWLEGAQVGRYFDTHLVLVGFTTLPPSHRIQYNIPGATAKYCGLHGRHFTPSEENEPGKQGTQRWSFVLYSCPFEHEGLVGGMLTHFVCAVLTFLPAGQVWQCVSILEEYVPGPHLRHATSGLGE